MRVQMYAVHRSIAINAADHSTSASRQAVCVAGCAAAGSDLVHDPSDANQRPSEPCKCLAMTLFSPQKRPPSAQVSWRPVSVVRRGFRFVVRSTQESSFPLCSQLVCDSRMVRGAKDRMGHES